MWQYYNLLFFDPHKHVLSLSLFYSIYSYSIHLQPQNCTERGSSSLTSVLLGERVFQLGTIIQYVRVPVPKHYYTFIVTSSFSYHPARVGQTFFSKERNVLAFFCVL